MNRAAVWLALASLCIGGCLRVEINESEGRLEISGGEVDVHNAILQLMSDRGWTQERAGGQTSSISSVRTGLGVSTQRGATLPGKSHTESSHSYIHAKTPGGKIVQFDIDRVTGRPTVVRIQAEQGAGVSIPQVTADLSRRLQPRHARGPLTIRMDPPAGESAEPNAMAGSWTARGDWGYPSSHIQLEIRDAKEGGQRHSLRIEDAASWRASDSSEGPISFRLDRRAGVMLFEGQRWRDGGSGTVTLEPNEVYVGELAELVGARPDTAQVLTLFFHDLALDYARQIQAALGDELTLQTLLKLSNYKVPADYVKGIRAAGYASSVDDIIKLSNYHVPLEDLQGFKRAGYGFSADELVQIRNHHVSVADFTGFRDAGYDFSIDDMIKAKNYHLPVEMARTLHEAGFRYDLDQLINLRNYHVPPEYIIAFKRAGYELSVDDIIKARNYHLDADEAARLRKAGYDFSLDELIKLRNYHVPVEFIIEVHDPQYENFTAQELIDFRQKRVSAETIKKIRAAKRRTQP